MEHIFERMYRPDHANQALPGSRRSRIGQDDGGARRWSRRSSITCGTVSSRIDVIYICSNGSIARQNINRLNVSDEKDATLPSRITLLPTVVRGAQEVENSTLSH